MTILQFPAAALFLAALLATALSRALKKGLALSYVGGLCWAAGTVVGLVDGASLRELVAVTLLLLLVSGASAGRDGAP